VICDVQDYQIILSRDELKELKSRVRELEAEKEGWKKTAAQHLRNEDYYRGLVHEVGKHFGADAYISDDGSIQQDILCAKVPDLVARMNERVWELESERTLFQEYVAKNPKVMEDAEREMELTERICELGAERDRLSKALITVQDERAASFAMLQKAVGEPYGLTPYQPEVDLEIAANIQRLRARHAALVEKANHAYSEWDGGALRDASMEKLKAALAEVT